MTYALFLICIESYIAYTLFRIYLDELSVSRRGVNAHLVADSFDRIHCVAIVVYSFMLHASCLNAKMC